MSVSKAESSIEVKAQNGLRGRDVLMFLNILLKEEQELIRDIRAPMLSAGHHSDFCDQADSTIFLHNEVSTRNHKSLALKKVKDAIDRIKNGTFGECIGPDECHTENEQCTGKIEISRLRSSPVARLCSHCLAERNAREKSSSKQKHAQPGY